MLFTPNDIKKHVLKIEPLTLPVRVEDIFKFFLDNPTTDYAPVLTGEGTCQVVHFKDVIPYLLDCNGNGCGHEVKKFRLVPIVNLAEPQTLTVEVFKNSLEQESPVAVFIGKLFIGLIPFVSVISIITEHRIKEAVMTSPLTGLPGNYSIKMEFARRKDSIFWVCYTDLNDFKAYNDKYGIAKGDEVIKFCACLLKEHSGDNFIGHIGGDDFVLFLPSDSTAILDGITQAFDLHIKNFYSDADKQQGYIISRDRTGRIQKFPIMSLSIAVTTSAGSFDDVSQRIAYLKKEAKNLSKQQRRSIYVVDRRTS